MQTTSFNPFSFTINEVLYQKNTRDGQIAVYQIDTHGITVTLNNEIILMQKDDFFYNEMFVHPALFTHVHPKEVAVVGPPVGMMQEIIKHPDLTNITCIAAPTPLYEAIQTFCASFYPPTDDRRIVTHQLDALTWLENAKPQQYDVIIQSDLVLNQTDSMDALYLKALRPDGILIKPCQFAWQAPQALKSSFNALQSAGFADWQVLNFPDPNRLPGWRSVIMARSHGLLNPIREKDIYNRNFTTRYYNFDTHKAALVIPEFMREALD